MNAELEKHLKPEVRWMLDNLSRQVGRDAVEVACEWYPDFADTPPEWKATVFQNVHDFLTMRGDPITPEYAKRAGQALLTNLECDKAAAEEANPTAPPAFVPKSPEVEADFFNNPNTSREAIRRYLEAKYATR
jgi:hypothetical protein